MTGIIYPERKPERFKCPDCGHKVFEVRNNVCKVCGMIAFLKFRHVMNWPLTAEDKERLGLT